MSIDIKIEPKEGKFEIFPIADTTAIKLSVRDALNDIADELENVASIFAPESDPDDKEGGSARYIPSGALKEHPVDITETGFGIPVNIAREAEGFRSVKAPAGAIDPITGKKIGGRFVKGKASASDFGHIFYNVVVSYPENPFYAKYVAFGTGMFGPYHQPIVSPTGRDMKFRYVGKRWKLASVMGQRPQAYLDDASHEVSTIYLPRKIEQLRAEINTII